MRTLLRLSVCLLFVHCARSPIKEPEKALRPTKNTVMISDDMQLNQYKEGLVQLIAAHEQKLNTPLRFGPRMVDRSLYVACLRDLLAALQKSPEDFMATLKAEFEIYEVYGDKTYGDVFITSYFEPLLNAAKKPKGALSQPLYQAPKDMVVIDIKAYQERFAHWSLFTNNEEQKSVGPLLRGRLVKGDSDFGRVVPYYDRKEIDELKSLKGQNLEIAYVDPVDAFVLQIQGSGTLMFPGGQRMKVGYAAQNGYPYVALGKFLLDRIPLEQMTLQRIESALHAMTEAERQAVMNQNPSYVFFKVLSGSALTFFGTGVVSGRTIATDQKFFPKGVLAFLEFSKPVFADATANEPKSFTPTGRLVFDQDTGGAIRGPGRVDLFWGQGDEAKRNAGVMKGRGRLFYFVPRAGGR